MWWLPFALLALALFGFAVAVDVARRPRVRHYRWRNRRWLRRELPLIELRDRARRGGPEEEDSGPRPPLVLAGVEPDLTGAPPAPSALVGAGEPQHLAPTRPQLVRLGGGLP